MMHGWGHKTWGLLLDVQDVSAQCKLPCVDNYGLHLDGSPQ